MLRLAALFGLIGLIGTVSIGCGSPKPTAVVKDYYAALEKGDMEAVAKCVTPETMVMIAPFASKAQEMLKNRGKIKSMTETVNGDDAIVEVTYENNETDTVDLIKVDGKWKVHAKGK